MDVPKRRGRPKKHPAIDTVSDKELIDELEQYKKFKLKKFAINLSLSNSFQNHWPAIDEMPPQLAAASKRKSFPLLSTKKLLNICTRRSFRPKTTDMDTNEFKVFDTVVAGFGKENTDSDIMESRTNFENNALAKDGDPISSDRTEGSDDCVNKIAENEEVESIENIEKNEFAQSTVDKTLEADVKETNNLPGSVAAAQITNESKIDGIQQAPIHEAPEISPKRRMNEVLRQLETTLSPRMTDLPNNNQDNMKLSRFGRHQKMKSGFDDFIPVEITRFINASPSKQKRTPMSVKTKDSNLEEQTPTPVTSSESNTLATTLPTNHIEVQCSDQGLLTTMDATKEVLPSPSSDKLMPSDADLAAGSSENEVVTNLCNGDILWGSVANSVFWPCIVCPDPDSEQSIKENEYGVITVKKSVIHVHVRFFCDNGRRCWVPIQKTLEFNGIEDLDTKLLDNAHLGKKQKRVPSIGQRASWKSAIMQAQDFVTYNKEDRYGMYLQILEKERLERIEQSKLKRSSLSSTTSTENLQKLHSEDNRKRSRSSSPDSPVFELLTAEGIKQEVEEDRIRSSCIDRYFKSIEPQEKIRPPAKKKIRLDNDPTTSICEEKTREQHEGDEIDNDPQFRKFFENLKATILNSNSTDLIDELKLYAKRIWLLKIFDSQQERSENLSKINKNLHRKLSLRKRSSSNRSRRSSATTTTESVTSMKKQISPKTIQPKTEELSLKEMFLSELEKNYLFKNMTREPVCSLCRKTGELIKCSGECGSYFHRICYSGKQSHVTVNNRLSTEDITAGNNNENINDFIKLEPIDNTDQQIQASTEASEIFQCDECSGNTPHKCFVCQKVSESAGSIEETIKCNVNGCGKFFHVSCLKNFPQFILDETSTGKCLFCPQHCCHTCVSDDPKQKTSRKGNKPPLIKCVACPSSYHFDSGCVPAGTEFLTASQILCSKHSVEGGRKNVLNINWCFICSSGGTLLCCELCPTSFHQECLDIHLPIQERYICDVCEAGRMPLYNEIVWAKYSIHRWWPAIILPPPVVPEMMLKKSHSAFEFCIRFFGSHDFGWIKRERVFLYQEGDSDSLKKSDKPIYNQALIEAKEIFECLQEQKKKEINDPSRFENRPPTYTRIKCNRPIPSVKFNGGEERDNNDDICDCVSSDEEPCGLSSNCINRTLNQECNPLTCPAGLKCCNQYFKNRIYPKMKVNRTPGRGWGLKALEEIKAGSFVIEYVGELIDNSELEERLKRKAEQNDENYYFLTINPNLIIDAGPKGNLSRFMNHSCEPNCQTQKWTVGGQTRIGLFALKDIQSNTELTFNYNLEAVGDRKKVCHCGAKTCSGFIGALKTDFKKTRKAQASLKKLKNGIQPNSQTNEAASKPIEIIHITGDNSPPSSIDLD